MKPTEGLGEKNLVCEDYSACVYKAAQKGWKDWNCVPCWREKFGDQLYRVTKSQKEEKEEKKMSESIGDKGITCLMKICKKCGQEKPIEEFRKHSQSLNGHINTCSECDGLLKAKRRRKTEEKKARTPKKKVIKEDIKPIEREILSLNLDVTNYPAIMEGLEKAAQANFRSVEHQAMYFLNEAVNESNHL